MKKKMLLTMTVLAVGLFAACGSAQETPDSGVNQVENSRGEEENKPTPTPMSEEPTKAPTPTPSPTLAPQFFYMENGDGIWITGLADNSVEHVMIPETLDGKTVTGIAAYAFNNANMLSVEISATVTIIQESVFYNCTKLQKLVIAEGNSVYTSKAADGTECNVILRIADGALMYGCNTSVIPEGTVTVEANAFSSSGIESIVLPESVVTVKSYAFQNCAALNKLVIEGNTTLEEYSFAQCMALEEIVSNGTVNASEKAFWANWLEKITVAEGNEYYTTKTEDGTECNGLWDKETGKLLLGCSSTVFAKEITSVASYAFCGTKFKELVIPDGVQVEDNGFYYYGSGIGNNMEIIKLTAPYEVIRTIGDKAIQELILTGDKEKLQGTQCTNFQMWKTLQKVTLPEGITSIENDAFAFDYALTEVIFPEGKEA